MLYNIIDFGAKADGSLCTKQIQKAIDDCFLAGGGEVVIPCGRFLVGGLRLRSNVTLHLLEGATLAGSTNPEDYFAYLDDEIRIETEMEKLGAVSGVVHQCIYRDESLLAEVKTKVAFIDTNTKKPSRLPDQLVEALS